MKLIDALDQSPVVAYRPKSRLNLRRRSAQLVSFTERPRIASIIFISMMLIILTSLLLAGCQTLNHPNTFNEKLATGYASLAAVRDGTTDLLIAKKIDVATAKNVQMQADSARDALDTARTIYKTDAKVGGDQLQKTLAIIVALQATLNTLKGSP